MPTNKARTSTNEADDEAAHMGAGDAAEAPEDSGIHESSPEVPVSEKFQQHAHRVISKANKHHLSHLRSKISDREDEIRQQEQSKKQKGKGQGPVEFDSSDMPE
jgi:hypothetical protein